MSEDAIYIKPHHFVDIITGLGAGITQYDPHPYGHAEHTVAAKILADPDVRLRIELGADDICRPCIHNVDGLCDDTIDTSWRPDAPPAKRQWNLLIDQRWCERVGITQGVQLTARQFTKLLGERAGDISDIYREIPPPRNCERAKNLQEGIKRFLEPREAD
ncbi:MAG: hypothetical protein KAX78_04000, partial [Phycisphaerae bacterium]|nr:hypothetical protein [Phycisphaerae bacterium]